MHQAVGLPLKVMTLWCHFHATTIFVWVKHLIDPVVTSSIY